MIAIIDYGAGNLESVVRAFARLGAQARITAEPSIVSDASAIVLPGVGFFDKAMVTLREKQLLPVLERRVHVDRVPLLGICLGFQMLTQHSEEGDAAGLGWLCGRTRRFAFNAHEKKVPQLGWNEVAGDESHPLLQGFRSTPCFYFAHSYYVEVEEPGAFVAQCDYGIPFVAMAAHENMVGVQFHPEKSHLNGLQFLKNFLEFTRCHA